MHCMNVNCQIFTLMKTLRNCVEYHYQRRSRGDAVGAPAPPGWRKKFRRNLQGKLVSAPPAHQVHLPGRVRVNFLDIFWSFGGGSGWFTSFRPSFEGDEQKKVVNFFLEKKCTPRQNPGYAYVEYYYWTLWTWAKAVRIFNGFAWVTLYNQHSASM